jgi:DNA-binding LytR/AlgR family response regulator
MTDQPVLRTLIVDDEPLAVERMQLMCADQPAIRLIGTANDGGTALRLIKALSPDLILLDIAMPEVDGIEVANHVLAGGGKMPAIIFVTAFDRFAIEAFDLEAVDYLLKPVAGDRLTRAIARVIAKVIEPRGDAAPVAAKTDYTQEFWVPYRSELIRVAAPDIERIDAERDYMRLGLNQRSYLLHQTIGALEARLDPSLFIRLHRSVIVRRDRIKALGHDRGGAWYAELVDGEQVRIGRTYLANAKQMAGRTGKGGDETE